MDEPWHADDEDDGEADSDEELGDKCLSLLSSLLPPGSVVFVPSPVLTPPSTTAALPLTLEELSDSPPSTSSPLPPLDDDQMEEGSSQGVNVRPRPLVPPKPQMDAVRYSMSNVKESANWELDALLEELSALETQLNSSAGGDQLLLGIPSLPASASLHQLPPPPTTKSANYEHQPAQTSLPQQAELRGAASSSSDCPSPDRDSAFGDGSSTESSTGSRQRKANRHSAISSSDSCRESLNTPSPTQQASPQQSAEELKAAKIREALEKMKEAKVTKIYVKFFVEDGAPLQMLVDERWTVAETMRKLAEKHQLVLCEDHSIIEEFPELYIRRIYEDHENMVENLQMWVQDSKNKLWFVRRPDKYAFIDRPEHFLVTEKTSHIEVPPPGQHWDLDTKRRVVKDFFECENVQPPELEGFLLLKADGKKTWKKQYFVLRSSGLYYSPKGKKTSKDLQCLMNLHSNQVYSAIDWKKKYKAPSEFGISIKMKRSQYIKYVCAEDESTYRKWITALRIAKNGRQLYDNLLNMRDFLRNSELGAGVLPRSVEVSRPPSTVPLRTALPLTVNVPAAPPSPSRLSTSASITSNDRCSSAARSTLLFECDEQPTGTIKRAPLDLAGQLRAGSRGERTSSSPSLGTPDEEDSDEEHFPPPPMIVATRTVTTPVQPTPPPRAPLTSCNGGVQSPSAVSPTPPPKPTVAPPTVATPTLIAQVAPMVAPKPTLMTPGVKKAPPPPPKRSEATRLQTTPTPPQAQNPLQTQMQSELEKALGRRREKIGQV